MVVVVLQCPYSNSLPRQRKHIRGSTVGMLGLCFNNEDQLMFINRAFSRISPKAKEKILFLLLFSVSYDFPGKADLINNTIFKSYIFYFE